MKNPMVKRRALHIFCRTAVAFAAVASVVACSGSASVSGVLENAPEVRLVVKALNVNKYDVLDTLVTGKDGSFSFKTPVAKGDPEFVYVFCGDRRVASLLLQRGDRVSVKADTLGRYEVSGSQESVKLAEVERAYADFTSRFNKLASELAAADPASARAGELKQEMGREYVAYYRDRLRYVMSDPYSLTVVPVLLQNVSAQLPVFSQETDALHIGRACDSLETVYPDSKYVKALRAESDRRMKELNLSMRIKNAEPVDYFDLNLPDVTGQRRSLSEIKDDVILIFFWTSTDARHKMYNQDVLKPVYEEFHSKGFEIYQVAADVDKTAWAKVVKDQGLGWINVCDGLGTASPSLAVYNVTELPTAFFLVKGDLVAGDFTDKASLRRQIKSLLSK